MSTAVYSADEVTVVFASILMQGFAEDEAVTVEMESDDYEDVVGVDGFVAVSKTRDERGTVTIKLLQTSPTNDVLSAHRMAGLLAPNGAGVGALLVKDRQGRSLYTAEHAWIQKAPDAAFARAAGAREWVIRCAKLINFTGGNVAPGGIV